eukprot:GHVO01044571.1.p1 GENE.GHVO01044571.1~~GHVO01044571.1.p1  ORF type:complete len:135 (+),score=9.54 GHVO01044571.1:141-545(+)
MQHSSLDALAHQAGTEKPCEETGSMLGPIIGTLVLVSVLGGIGYYFSRETKEEKQADETVPNNDDNRDGDFSLGSQPGSLDTESGSLIVPDRSLDSSLDSNLSLGSSVKSYTSEPSTTNFESYGSAETRCKSQN